MELDRGKGRGVGAQLRSLGSDWRRSSKGVDRGEVDFKAQVQAGLLQ